MAHKLPKNKTVLLLQGPMGPFFWKFKRELLERGNIVYKINFCGGDDLFYSDSLTSRFVGDVKSEFESYLDKYIDENQIDRIYLFGDCRHHHVLAVNYILKNRPGLGVFVLEEGYIRPHYLTIEAVGVNGFSLLPDKPEFYEQLKDVEIPKPEHSQPKHWKMWGWATAYALANFLKRRTYPHYKHHKSLNLIGEAFRWVRSLVRKCVYAASDNALVSNIAKARRKMFFVPLQVFNDSQIIHHSRYQDVREFIQEVTHSFMQNAPANSTLLIKQHPMDRGHRTYRRLSNELNRLCDDGRKICFVTEGHLPTILRKAAGCIVVNSTVGLSAIIHNCPVKVMGKHTPYDIKEITNQCTLEEFWSSPVKPNRVLVDKFVKYVCRTRQVNGSIIGKFPKFD